MRVIYFDLETAGLDMEHPIIQLAAVSVDERTWEELGYYEAKIRFDEADADNEALAINHYDPHVWEEQAVPKDQALRGFASFMEPYKDLSLVSKRTGRPYKVARLCGHNAASFDAPRLQLAYKNAGLFLPADPRVRDTMQQALEYFDSRDIQPESYKLGVLCKHFGVEVGEDAHDALYDVRLTVKLAKAMRDHSGEIV